MINFAVFINNIHFDYSLFVSFLCVLVGWQFFFARHVAIFGDVVVSNVRIMCTRHKWMHFLIKLYSIAILLLSILNFDNNNCRSCGSSWNDENLCVKRAERCMYVYTIEVSFFAPLFHEQCIISPIYVNINMLNEIFFGSRSHPFHNPYDLNWKLCTLFVAAHIHTSIWILN